MIYYITFSMIPSLKANGVQATNMCQAFADLGQKVRFSFRPSNETSGELFDYYGLRRNFHLHPLRSLNVKILNRVTYALSAARYLYREETPGLVYTRDPFTAGILGLLRMRNKPIMLEVHAPPRNQFWTWWMSRLLKSPSLAGLVVISHALEGEYLRLFPGLDREIVLVAHDAAQDYGEEGTVEPAPIPGDSRRPRVGYIGSLRPGKGMEIICQLAPLLPHLDFHVVGGDGETTAKWRQAAKFDNLIFHGFVPPAQTDAYIAAMDILLAPYQPRVLVGDDDVDIGRWMSPLKIFEYMRRGKVIVASDLPVLREILEHGSNALLVDPDDIAGWRDLLSDLAQDQDLRERLGMRARRDFSEQHTWEMRARKILDAGQTALKARGIILRQGAN